mmetsp:Transcript_14240/g.42450  ORF Transcript_14240/g.42450 Transcript_14240/m.42450 type:complete len:203 (-) Transcript_14240:183-791(-)
MRSPSRRAARGPRPRPGPGEEARGPSLTRAALLLAARRQLHLGRGRVSVGIALQNYLVGDVQERIVDALPGLRRRLEEGHVEFLGESLSVLAGHLAILGEVGLVADQYPLDRRVPVLVELLHPVPHVVEGVPIGYVVGEDHSHGGPVVRRRDGAKPLLAGGVPNLNFELPSIALHVLPLVVDTDGDHKVGVEAALAEPQEER